MSIQPQQPQTQQPAVVYPNNVPAGQAPPPHSHSNGSFGPVFIVLAVIVVVSVIACFIGRLCNRRRNQTEPSAQNRNHDFRPKERDVEFGVDGRIPGAKPSGGNGGEPSKGFKMPGNEELGGPGMAEQGDPTIPRTRIPGNGDPRGRTRVHANGNPAGLRIAEPKPVDDGALKHDA